jgi:hypothetical protein
MGSQRLASRLISGAGGGWKAESTPALDSLKQRQQDDLKAMLAHYDFDEIHYSTASDVEEALDSLKQRQQDDLKAMLKHYEFDEIHFTTASDVEEDSVKTTNLYYFHPDHLGSSTLITDNLGNPYQFFLNLPFGEPNPPFADELAHSAKK